MKRALMFFKKFRKDVRGAIAVEFALVFPVLLSTYLFLADISIAINDNRRVADIASSSSQIAASFPIFDTSVRVSLYRNLDAHAMFLNGRDLEATLLSVVRDESGFRLLYSFGLNGAMRGRFVEPPENWREQLDEAMYLEGDAIILVYANIESASYFSRMFPNGTLFQDWAQTQPYNSRTYNFRWFSSRRDRYNWQ